MTLEVIEKPRAIIKSLVGSISYFMTLEEI